jgi:hypothetical protein
MEPAAAVLASLVAELDGLARCVAEPGWIERV